MYYIILYCIVLYYIILYCTILYYIVLYYIILYCIVLYYIILYCTILYYIVLYYIILYFIILYNHNNNMKESPEEVVQSVKLSLASVDKANHGKCPIHLGYGRLHLLDGACNQWLYVGHEMSPLNTTQPLGIWSTRWLL